MPPCSVLAAPSPPISLSLPSNPTRVSANGVVATVADADEAAAAGVNQLFDLGGQFEKWTARSAPGRSLRPQPRGWCRPPPRPHRCSKRDWGKASHISTAPLRLPYEIGSRAFQHSGRKSMTSVLVTGGAGYVGSHR